MIVIAFVTLCHQRAWEVPDYLINKGGAVHSLYTVERFDVPYYSWFHGFDTKIYPPSRDPKFARLAMGDPLPLSSQDEFASCVEMIYKITSGDLLP